MRVCNRMPKRKVLTKGLLNACSRGDHEFVAKRLRSLPKSKDLDALVDNHNFNLLHHAVRSRSVDCVRAVLSNANLKKSARTYEGHTALFLAIHMDCSLDLIKTLIEHYPDYINISNNEHVYPIHEAITKPNSMEIVQVLVETAKEQDVRLIDHVDWDGDNSILLAARANKLDLLRYLVENTPFDVKHENDVGINAFSAICLSETDAPEKTLDFLYPLMYGDVDEEIKNLLLPMFLSINRGQCIDWFVRKIYLRDSNDLKPLVARVLGMMASGELDNRGYYIIMLLHSHLRGNESEILQLKPSLPLLITFCFEVLFIMFRKDKDLFHPIAEYFNRHFHFPPYVDSDAIVTNFRMLVDAYEERLNPGELVEFLSKMNIQQLQDCLVFERILFYPTVILCDVLGVLMPFIALPSADDLLKKMRPVEAWKQSSELDLIAQFCGQPFHTTPLPLTSICRIMVRATVFDANKNLSMDGKLEKLKTFDLPNEIRNFLFYNYTRFDLVGRD